MKRLPTLLAASFALGGMIVEASAQNRNTAPASSPYKYCLEETTGGAGGGPLPLLCRFTTLQQCQQSRASPSDRCVPNITGQRS